MKRGNTEVVFGTFQSAKKAKIDDFALPATVNDGMLQGSSSSTPNQDQTDGWTKVEKRKKKKEVKLLDGKRDVRTVFFVVTPITNQGSCTCIMSLTTTTTTATPYAQTTNPRFMYSNHEIVKRSNAISIDASRSFRT